jgi:hypothetical protein
VERRRRKGYRGKNERKKRKRSEKE